MANYTEHVGDHTALHGSILVFVSGAERAFMGKSETITAGPVLLPGMKEYSGFLFVALSTLGFLSYRCAAWSIYHSEFSATTGDAFLGARIIQIAVIVVLVLLDKRLHFSATTWVKLIVASTCAMLMGALCVNVGISVFAPSSRVPFVGCLIHGLGSACLFMGWGKLFCHVAPRYAATSIALTFLLYNAFVMLVKSEHVVWLSIFSVLFPIVCGILLQLCFSVYNPVLHPDKAPVQIAKSGIPWEIVSLLIVCGAIGAGADAFLSSELAQGVLESSPYGIIVSAVALVAVFAWIYVIKQDSIYNLWPFFTFLLFCGLLCFVSFFYINTKLSFTFLQAVQGHLNCFIWLCLTNLIHEYRLPSTTWFGVGSILLIQGEHFLAQACSAIFPFIGIGISDKTSIIFMAVLSAILIVLTMFVFAKSIAKLMRRNMKFELENIEDPYVLCVAEISTRYNLTPREGEIARYLLNGYTYQAIADKLYISINTVRYYMKQIYKKMGVDNKQSFIKECERVLAPTRTDSVL